MPEPQDDLFDNLDDDDQHDQSDDAENADDAPDDDDSDDQSQSDSDKRLNDLMSKWQKAEARAKKAEAELAKTKQPTKTDDAPKEDEFTQFMRENVRSVLFGQNPILKEYGFKESDIAGQTPAEMRASLSRLTKQVNAMEARAFQRAQEQLGIDPGITGSVHGDKLPDFAAMSDEEFEKYL